MAKVPALAIKVLTAACACVVFAHESNAQATFAPGTDPSYVERVHQAFIQWRGSPEFVGGSRWDVGSQGDPLLITYSFVQDGTTIPAQAGLPGDVAGPSVLFETLDDAFGDRDTWQTLIADAFQRWADVSGLTFEFRRRLVPGPPPDDPVVDNWDGSTDWTDPGPLNGDTTGIVGDIRFGMRGIDGAGGTVAFSPGPPAGGDGNIILDRAENWADPEGGFVFFDNAVGRVIGSAFGLAPVCPINETKLMEPLISLSFVGPQHDDVRAVQRLYGDIKENNDDRTVTGSVFIPSNANTSLARISIDDTDDEDVFNFTISGQAPDVTIFITASPVGFGYESGPFAGGICVGDTIDSSSIHNLKIGIFDSTNAPVLPASDIDAEGFVNLSPIGEAEQVEANITVADQYFLVIKSGGESVNETQLYNLSVAFESAISAQGVAFGPIANDHVLLDSEGEPDPAGAAGAALPLDLVPIGHGAQFLHAQGFSGERARYGNVEADQPSPDHLVFFGRPITALAWDGRNPAVNEVGPHPTAATGAAAGSEFGTGADSFEGMAPKASLASATIAEAIFPDGSFFVSPEALHFALYALAHPETAALAGNPAPITVMNNSWGGLGDFTGDGVFAWAYDTVANLTGVTIVASAGNAGGIDNTSTCGGAGGDIPGGPYRGGRTIGSPATSFNVISVGAVGKGKPPEEEPPGGGGPGPGPGNGTGGGPGGGDPDPQTLFLDTVADFSSKGPVDSFDWDGLETEFNIRAGIHLVAAGTGLLDIALNPEDEDPPGDPCMYPGHQPSSQLVLPSFDEDDPANAAFFASTSGTSFSGPTVAGAVALLQDLGLAQTPPHDIHADVMKAVLMTSAVKLLGWSNNGDPGRPQDNRDGRNPLEEQLISPATEQPLDFAQGAGLLDVVQAAEVYHFGFLEEDLQGYPDGTFDLPQTDPDVPTIRDPPNEPDPPPGIPPPGNAVVGGGDTQLNRMPPSPLEIARRLRQGRGKDPEIFTPYRRPDFDDPDLGSGGGKSGGGIDFEPRVPFKPPVGPIGGPGGDEPPPSDDIPVEIPLLQVGPLGWDRGNIGKRFIRQQGGGTIETGFIDYQLNVVFPIDSVFVASLAWMRNIKMEIPDFSKPDDPQFGQLTSLELENLDLFLFPTDAQGNITGPAVASSTAVLNNVEHLVFVAPFPGHFMLRVQWIETEYDLFLNEKDGSVQYALAWRCEPSLAAPGPGVQMPSDPVMMLNRLLSAYGAVLADATYDAQADLNRDGIIDSNDLNLLLANWPGGN